MIKNTASSPIINALLQSIENHPFIFTDDASASVLDFLYQAYADTQESDSEEVKLYYQEIDSLLSGVSLDVNNKIFTMVCKIIIECEQRAFTDGIKIGASLIRELRE